MKPSIISSLLLLLLTGCVTHRDVSHNSRFATDYVVGATYRVQRTLVVRNHSNGYDLVLWPPDDGLPLQEVIKRNQTPGSDFVDFLPAGTLLVVSKLDLYNSLESRIVWVWGRCVDGPFKDKRVLLSFVSKNAVSTNVMASVSYVDTNMLQIVNKP